MLGQEEASIVALNSEKVGPSIKKGEPLRQRGGQKKICLENPRKAVIFCEGRSKIADSSREGRHCFDRRGGGPGINRRRRGREKRLSGGEERANLSRNWKRNRETKKPVLIRGKKKNRKRPFHRPGRKRESRYRDSEKKKPCQERG